MCTSPFSERGRGKRREVSKYINKETAPHLIDELDLLFLDANFHLIYKNMLE